MSSFVLNLHCKGNALQQQRKKGMGPTAKVMSTVQEKRRLCKEEKPEEEWESEKEIYAKD